MTDSTHIPTIPNITEVVSDGILALFNAGSSAQHEFTDVLELDWPPTVTDAETLLRFANFTQLGSWGEIRPVTLGDVSTPKKLIYRLMAEYARKVLVPILARNAKPEPWPADDSVLQATWAQLGAPQDRDGITAYRVELLDQIGKVIGVKVKKVNPPYTRGTMAANPTDFLQDITALCRVAATTEKKSGGGGGE